MPPSWPRQHLLAAGAASPLALFIFAFAATIAGLIAAVSVFAAAVSMSTTISAPPLITPAHSLDSITAAATWPWLGSLSTTQNFGRPAPAESDRYPKDLLATSQSSTSTVGANDRDQVLAIANSAHSTHASAAAAIVKLNADAAAAAAVRLPRTDTEISSLQTQQERCEFLKYMTLQGAADSNRGSSLFPGAVTDSSLQVGGAFSKVKLPSVIDNASAAAPVHAQHEGDRKPAQVLSEHPLAKLHQVARAAMDGGQPFVVVTSTNVGYCNLTLSWEKGLASHGVLGRLLVAESPAAAHCLRSGGVLDSRIILLPTPHVEETSAAAEIGTKSYAMIVLRRPRLLRWLLDSLRPEALGGAEVAVIWADTDVAFAGDPWPHLSPHRAGCDVQVQSDSACSGVEGLDDPTWDCRSALRDLVAPPAGSRPLLEDIVSHEGASSMLCTGLMLLEGTPAARRLVEEWDALVAGSPNSAVAAGSAQTGDVESTAKLQPAAGNDPWAGMLNQPAFSGAVVKLLSAEREEGPSPQFPLRVCLMSRSLFPTGRLFLSREWRKRQVDKPVAIHLNWVRGLPEKERLMNEFCLWNNK